MSQFHSTRRDALRGAAALAGASLLPQGAFAQETIDRVNFLVGFGVGGGFDQTARGAQEALQKSGLVANVSVENRTGGGGSVAIAHLIETAARQQNTLMVNGTSIVVRSLNREFAQTFRDVTLVSTITAEIFGLLVAANSPHRDIAGLTAALRANARAVRFGGGSPRGGIDHLAASKYLKQAGVDPKAMQYVAYDGGGRATAGLLGNEVQCLVMPYSESLTQIKAGQMRLLAIMNDRRVADVPDVPTLADAGIPDAVLANVRAFFMAPGTPPARVEAYANLLQRLIATPAWEEVRARNGWNMFFRRGAEAQTFFVQHERDIRALLVEQGFIQG
ncbi:MAG: tripartite tricarboxylate transporter substrate binding protein [Tagaea sp.]|nr:tripartite tricarboxylate transporter substrate binding protein [Tagaea sp.]